MSDHFNPAAHGVDRTLSYSFYVERLFDAVKQSGTGNSAGLFGAGVALYYFGGRSAEIAALLKATAFVYFGGVFLFAFSYVFLASFIINGHPSLSGSMDYTPGRWRYWTSVALTALAFVTWLVGSGIAAYTIFNL